MPLRSRPRSPFAAASLAVLFAFGIAAATATDAQARRLQPAVQTTTTSSDTLQVGVRLPGFPHAVDVYRPAGATRAIVFLHGHGGRSWQMAYDIGVNRKYRSALAKNVDWSALKRLGVIAIFPQGQAPAVGQLPTWNNHVFDSGQDDVAFLSALAAHARSAWGARSVSLSGHSSGGTMTARMWCEGTPAFDAFFSIAGPMPSADYPHVGPTCMPLAHRPYAVVIGDRDSKLGVFAVGVMDPTPAQAAAGLTDSILLAEWWRHGDRGENVCGNVTTLESEATAAGPSWSACGGTLRYTVVNGADHPIASIEQHAGQRMLDWVAGFQAATAPR